MAKKRALITGIFGQDGSYLSELLYWKGYDVHGVEKDPLTDHAGVLYEHLKKKGVSPLTIHNCDLNSYEQVRETILKVKPDECYHLAATHYSSEYSARDIDQLNQALFYNNVSSTLNLIRSISDISSHTRFVMAGSCLMFEDSDRSPQTEGTPYAASSAYALSKIEACRNLRDYRDERKLHLSAAILYNHESPRRQAAFISKKIVTNLVRVKKKEIKNFLLGDLNSVRDWGYAKDYVYGMWLMAQCDKPQDYILATGEPHTVKDFVLSAARILGVDSRDVVKQDSSLIRPSPKAVLVGDPARAKEVLNWKPSVSFEELVEILVKSELNYMLD